MKKKKIIVTLTIVIIFLGSVGYATYHCNFRDYFKLPVCITDKPFTAYPVDMSKINCIVPLGNLNPEMGHVFPSDKIVFSTNVTAYPEGFDVFAPGNITIFNFRYSIYDEPIHNVTQDISIDFDVCRASGGKKLWGSFDHVNNLSSHIWSIIKGFGTEYGDLCDTFELGDNRVFTIYTKKANIKIGVGELIGIAGWMGGVQLTLKDTRTTLDFINDKLMKDYKHSVSPFAYFRDDLRLVMKSMLLNPAYEPVYPAGYEGKIDFDILGTAQGVWFQEGHLDSRAEDYGLGLVFSGFNSSQPMFSIGITGNITWDRNCYEYLPKNTGYQDRLFNDITNDGNVYYFFVREVFWMPLNKVILLKMTSEKELYLQFIDTGGSPPVDPASLFSEELAVRYIR